MEGVCPTLVAVIEKSGELTFAFNGSIRSHVERVSFALDNVDNAVTWLRKHIQTNGSNRLRVVGAVTKTVIDRLINKTTEGDNGCPVSVDYIGRDVAECEFIRQLLLSDARDDEPTRNCFPVPDVTGFGDVDVGDEVRRAYKSEESGSPSQPSAGLTDEAYFTVSCGDCVTHYEVPAASADNTVAVQFCCRNVFGRATLLGLSSQLIGVDAMEALSDLALLGDRSTVNTVASDMLHDGALEYGSLPPNIDFFPFGKFASATPPSPLPPACDVARALCGTVAENVVDNFLAFTNKRISHVVMFGPLVAAEAIRREITQTVRYRKMQTQYWPIGLHFVSTPADALAGALSLDQ